MSKPKFKISCEAKDNKAVIRIDGYIRDWNNNAAGFKASLDALIEQGIVDADIYLNTPGGDCFQANEIVNEIKRFTGTLTCRLGALCASAGTYIASNCDKVIISENTSYMIHKPMGGVDGNSDEIKSVLKVLENLEKLYVNSYAGKTGMPVAEIKKLWVTDYWMDATECIEKGFADEIEGEAEITNDDIEAIASYKNAPKLAASVKTTNPTPNNQNPKNMKELALIIAALGMPEASTPSEVLAQMSILKAKADKADALKLQLENLTKKAAEDKADVVVAGAIAAKKIVASQKDFFKKSLVADFDGTKAIIDAMPVATQLSAVTEGAASAEDRSKWTYADYQDKNPEALAELAKNDEAHFEKLFNAHYGKKK